MECPADIVKKAFKHQLSNRIPRGELWLGREIFKRLNLNDDISGHFKAVKILYQDIISFPLSEKVLEDNVTNYRYFSLKEIFEATKINDGLFLMIVIDGPFQRISRRIGLMNALSYLSRKWIEIKNEIEEECSNINFLIDECLDLPIDAFVIADDLAGEDNLFISPKLFNDIFSDFFSSLISKVRKKGLFALFHSCGDINQLVPRLISIGFDGLASIQDRSNDLLSLKERFGHILTLMGGIDSEILEAKDIQMDKLKEFETRLKMITKGGGFILSSASGLYRGDFIDRVKEIYKIADKVVDNYSNYT